MKLDFKKSDWCFISAITAGLLAVFVTSSRIPLATLILVIIMLVGMGGMVFFRRRDE